MSRISNPFTVQITNPPANAIEQALSGLNSGDWVDLTCLWNGGVMSADMVNTGGASPGSALGYSVRMVYDDGNNGARAKTVYFLGSGHASEGRFIKYDLATNNWTRVHADITPGHALANHGYCMMCVQPSNGRLHKRQYDTGTIWSFPYGGNSLANWTTSDVAPFTYGGGGAAADGLEWWSAVNGGAGGLVRTHVSGAQISNSALSGWTNYTSPQGIGNIGSWSGRTSNYVYFGGGGYNTPENANRINASGSITQINDPPFLVSCGAGNSGVAVAHPNGAGMLLFPEGSNGVWYCADSGTSWSNIGDKNYGAVGNSCVYQLGVAMPNYNCVMFMLQSANFVAPKFRLYKT